MSHPALTATYAALLAILYLALTLWVSAGRFGLGVLHGDGGRPGLNRRIRAHGNFAEYVPLALLLCALLEGRGAAPATLHLLLAPLMLGRLLHPFGMTAGENTPRQFLCRGLGSLLTWLVLLAAALLLLLG